MFIPPHSFGRRVDNYISKMMICSWGPIVAGATTAGTMLSGAFGAGSMLPNILTAVSAFSSIRAGYASKAALNAKAEDVKAVEAEKKLMRLQKLRSIQATQRSYYQTRGLSPFAGTSMFVQKKSTRAWMLESGAAAASTSRQIQQLNKQASSAVTAGWVKGASIMSDWS